MTTGTWAMASEPAWDAADWPWNGEELTSANITQPDYGLLKAALHAHDTGKLDRGRHHRAVCQVAGCCVDVTHATRAYYRRYRICESHFRSSQLVVDGKISRFCQQCAKFQAISEFEGDKRSCRRQLAMHNARRNKRKQATKQQEVFSSGQEKNAMGKTVGHAQPSPTGPCQPAAPVEAVLAQFMQQSLSGSDSRDSSSLERMLTAVAAALQHSAQQDTASAPAVPTPTSMLQGCISLQQRMAELEAGTGAVLASQRQSTTSQPQMECSTSSLELQAMSNIAFACSDAMELAPHADKCQRAGNTSGSGVARFASTGQLHLDRPAVKSDRPSLEMDLDPPVDPQLASAARELLATWADEMEEMDLDGRTMACLMDEDQGLVRSSSLVADQRLHGGLSHAMGHIDHTMRGGHLSTSCGLAGVPYHLHYPSILTSNQACPAPPSGMPHASSSVFSSPFSPTTMARQSQHGLLELEVDMAKPAVEKQTQPGFLRTNSTLADNLASASSLGRVLHTLSNTDRLDSIRNSTLMQPLVHAQPEVARCTAVPTPEGWHSGCGSYGPSSPANEMLQLEQQQQTAHVAQGLHPSRMEYRPSGTLTMPRAVSLAQDMGTGASYMGNNYMRNLSGSVEGQPSMPLSASLFTLDHSTPGSWMLPINEHSTGFLETGQNQPQLLYTALSSPTGASGQWPQSSAPMGTKVPLAQVCAPLHPVLACLGVLEGHPQTNRGSHAHGGSCYPGAAGQSQSNKVYRTASPAYQQPRTGATSLLPFQEPEHIARSLEQANYMLAEASLTRLSIKLHGVTPEALPADLRDALTSWLSSTDARLLQGYIRPGCVHLTLDCALAGDVGLDQLAGLNSHGAADLASSLPPALARLFEQSTLVEVQTPSKLVLVEGKAVWSVTPLERRRGLPVLHSVSPLALLSGCSAPQRLVVSGAHLESVAPDAAQTHDATAPPPQGPGCALFVRSAGRFVQQGLTASLPHVAVEADGEAGLSKRAVSPNPASAASCSTWGISVDTSGTAPGLAMVEVQSGRFLSACQPVLVVDDLYMLAELSQLEGAPQRLYPGRVAGLLTDLGLLLQLQSAHLGKVCPQPVGQAVKVEGHGQWVAEDDEEETEDSDEDDVASLAGSDVSIPSVDEDGDADDAEDSAYEEEREAQARGRSAHAVAPGYWNNVAADPSSWESSQGMLAACVTETVRDRSANTMSDIQDQCPSKISRQPASVSGCAPDAPATAPSRGLTPQVREHMARRGLRLLHVACDMGWPATALCVATILTTIPLLSLPHSKQSAGHEDVSATDVAGLVPMSMKEVLASTVQTEGVGAGLSPLHRAARSNAAVVVEVLLALAARAGLSLNPASRGAASESPLHLVAMHKDGARCAVALLRASAETPLAWFLARESSGGLTAAQTAYTQGCISVNRSARALVQQLALAAPPTDAQMIPQRKRAMATLLW